MKRASSAGTGGQPDGLGFTISDENAPAIAQIVRRLDGLPLAIELAAIRVKVLPPEAILPRLEHSLGLLTGGSRDLPDRLQTLRARSPGATTY